MGKITFMGAGSTVFAKNVLGDSMLTPSLSGFELSLYDIDAERLEESYAMVTALNKNINEGRAKVTKHLGVENRKEALRGADFVVNAIQVGGYEPCTVTDFEVPKKYGLRQTIADTLGIGGIFRTLRTLPVMLDFAHDIEEVAPKAWFLNYTNPMAILSAAASLLVPEFARLSASRDRTGTVLLARRALFFTLCFAGGCFAVLAAFAAPLGRLLFGSCDAGRFIWYLSPVVPVMFLDHVTDAALKGLGEQVAVMWINIADAALTVLLILYLLPKMGILGYILMIALTEVFNFGCSLWRLMKTTGYLPDLSRAVPPLFCACSALLFARAFLSGGARSVPALAVGGAATLSLYLLPFLLFRRKASKNAPGP